ncbi:MAG: CHASE3 domain-containing protein [Methylocella sp.]|jgi:signal transduction histidine kinase/ActR/RegA family two-component response regulator
MQRISISRADFAPALLFALVPLAFLAAITFYQFFKNVPDARLAREDTKKTFLIVRTASAVDEAIQDAERGQRGYLITGRDSYLDPYNSAKEHLPHLLVDLQQAVADRPEQQRRLLALQGDLTTKMNELAETIAKRREQGFGTAQAMVNTDAGRIAMEAVEADIGAIIDAADMRLQARMATAESLEQRVLMTFLIGSIIAACALIAGAILLARAYRRAASSERLLQATLDSVREGVAAFDADRRLIAWNQTFSRMLKLPRRTLQRREALPAGKTAEIDRFNDYFETLDAEVKQTGRAALMESKEADGRSLEIFHNPAEDGGSVTTFLDRTEQRQTEEALRQAQKLEALGQMTGGIAHDFNNLLTVIIGATHLLQRAVAKDAQALQRIDMVTVAAERGARLIQQLLAFARRQPLEPEIVNLGHLMTEVLPMVRRAVGEKVSVEYVTSGGLWNTTIDATQFQTAVLNLAINGRDAMPDGGKLTIEVANAALDDAYAASHPEVEPGQYVMFAITDTGKGMDAATSMRALDPFFTTKPVGEGTGLGLPQVYGFVKQTGGHLKIYSEVDEGTTIKLYLPRELGDVFSQPRQAAALALTGTETVLLVDDDEIVRATVASMLESLGYEVLTASSGVEALSILENGTAIALLFTDVVMPGPISGRKLAERAMVINPAIKILFTSGYTENSIVHNSRLDTGVEFLSKPFDRERLAIKVRRVLDGPTKKTGDSGPDGTGGQAPADLSSSSAGQ